MQQHQGHFGAFTDDNTVMLSPNPVRDLLYLRGHDKVSTLCIYDIGGREVMRV